MNATEIVVAVIAIGALLWDIWLYADKHPGNSITQVVIARSKQYPIIPFALGFLFGHFYG
jgi:hypothetical protein